MKTRSDSQNFISDSLELDKVDKFIRKKRNDGLKGFGIMHVLIAAYIRTVSQRPAINRFIGGQWIYARHNIEVVLAIKREMTLESPDTVIKAEFDASATATDVYNKFNELVENYRNEPGSSFDSTAKFLHFIPRLLLKFVVWILTILDYFGKIPRKLTKLSPFHGSFFITSMGSLGIPPIYHHLYNFGNVPLFLSFGAKKKRYVLNANGEVKEEKYLDFKIVMDERICDGFYFASAFKILKNYMKDPFVLDKPPEEIAEDVE